MPQNEHRAEQNRRCPATDQVELANHQSPWQSLKEAKTADRSITAGGNSTV